MSHKKHKKTGKIHHEESTARLPSLSHQDKIIHPTHHAENKKHDMAHGMAPKDGGYEEGPDDGPMGCNVESDD